jgi:plastocyanin
MSVFYRNLAFSNRSLGDVYTNRTELDRMKFVFSGVLAAATVAWCVCFASAATVSGNFEHPSVVWISQPSPLKPTELEMRNRDRQFIPQLLILHAGNSVRFPNDDPYYHSIYSVTSQDPFDIGYYGNGPGKVVDFATAGIIEVRCHIHPSMHGTIIVADGPVTAAPVTAFSLAGIAPGNHAMHIWSDGAAERTVQITVPAAKPSLDLGKI